MVDTGIVEVETNLYRPFGGGWVVGKLESWVVEDGVNLGSGGRPDIWGSSGAVGRGGCEIAPSSLGKLGSGGWREFGTVGKC